MGYSQCLSVKNEGFGVICWAVKLQWLFCQKRSWSVKTQTNQISDKYLWSRLRMFTLQQLAFKTKELWLKMNSMQPKLVFHTPGESDTLRLREKAHQLPTSTMSRDDEFVSSWHYLFLKASTHSYNMIWFPLESQNCQIITTFLILNLS